MAVNKVLFGGTPIMDITDSTVTPDTLAKGATAYAASGEKIVGTMEVGATGATVASLIDCSITEVEIPQSATSIRPFLFSNCSSLNRVTIPNTVTHIGEYAFDSCTSLKSIVLPEGLNDLYYYAFANCYSLENVVFRGTPNEMYGYIDTAAFASSAVKHMFVPWGEGEWVGAPWGATNATIHYNIKHNVTTTADNYVSFFGSPKPRYFSIEKPNGEVLRYQGTLPVSPDSIDGVGYTDYWIQDTYYDENSGEIYEGMFTPSFRFTNVGTFYFWGETEDGTITSYEIYDVKE